MSGNVGLSLGECWESCMDVAKCLCSKLFELIELTSYVLSSTSTCISKLSLVAFIESDNMSGHS